MRYSRTGIVAVLLAAETFIVGAMIWSVAGAAPRPAAAPVAAGIRPIDAGNAPHIVIDDPDSGLTITASSDRKVHVTDDSQMHGWFIGSSTRAPLRVTHIPGGVVIERNADAHVHVALFGFDREHVSIAIPPESALEVRRCSGARVSGLQGDVRIHSVDGRIELRDVRASTLALLSDDGSVRLYDVAAPAGGSVHTEDGSITLALASTAGLSIHARTEDGSLRYNGQRVEGGDDSSVGDFTVGGGGPSLAVSTRDGSITITTNGAQ